MTSQRRSPFGSSKLSGGNSKELMREHATGLKSEVTMAAEKVRQYEEDKGFFRKPELPEEISRTIK